MRKKIHEKHLDNTEEVISVFQRRRHKVSGYLRMRDGELVMIPPHWRRQHWVTRTKRLAPKKTHRSGQAAKSFHPVSKGFQGEMKYGDLTEFFPP